MIFTNSLKNHYALVNSALLSLVSVTAVMLESSGNYSLSIFKTFEFPLIKYREFCFENECGTVLLSNLGSALKGLGLVPTTELGSVFSDAQ